MVAACVFIIALDFVLFRKSLSLYFIQDDFWYLWLTSDQSIRGFAKLFTTPTPFYRPISNSLYFFFMQLVFGVNPLPYHVANLLAHAFNSLAVGYLVYLLTENRALAFVSSVIFTSRVGHVIAVYWICVTTQSWPLMFFLISLILYIHYHRSARPGLLAGSYFCFALCAFSNINGPTLVLLITLYDLLMREGRSLLSIARREAGFYAIVLVFLILQFVIFKYPEHGEYHVSAGPAALKVFGIINVYAFNLLYLISYLTDGPAWMVAVSILVGLAVISFALLAFIRAARRKQSSQGRLYLFFGFWYIWGFAPHLGLTGHIWPQYITVAAVGLSFLLASLLVRFLRPKALAAALCLILALSFFSVRLFEKEEYDAKGIIYKSELARNIISDLREDLKRDPGVETIIILNGQVELWWILRYGRNAEVFVDKFRPIFYLYSADGATTDSSTLVLRYDNMHLYVVR